MPSVLLGLYIADVEPDMNVWLNLGLVMFYATLWSVKLTKFPF